MVTPALSRRREWLDTAIAWGDAQCRLNDSIRLDQGRDLVAEIVIRPVDAFAEHIAHKPRNLDRSADLALHVLDRLRNTLVRIMDEGLIKQAHLLVKSLEPRFDDLVDHIRGFFMSLILVGK